jgi:hypothetical protein
MREEVAAMITMLALLEGVFFDTRDFRRLPYDRNLINRVLKSLLDSKVLTRIHDRRNYVLTDEFRETLKREVQRKAPRSGIHQFPALDVFYVGGIEDWSEHEFESYVGEIKAMWRRLSQDRKPPSPFLGRGNKEGSAPSPNR